MRATKLSELIKDVGITSKPELLITDVVIDSRKVSPGCLYVAIIGENFDGNDFVASAFKAGATAAVVSRRADCEGEQIVVSDTRFALGKIASNYRDMFSFGSVGITGSVGKTTTKEMCAAMLSMFGKTLKTEGNLNNQIGLPLTMFRLDEDDRYAAIEMGLTDFGEVGNLSRILKPQIGIVTQIGISHIEYLKTQENILKAKLEIADAMPDDGVMVLNASDELLMANRHLIKHRIVTFSGDEHPDADVYARGIIQNGFNTEFVIVDKEKGSFRAVIPAIGKHNVFNAVAAYTAVTRLGCDPERAISGVMDYQPAGMRQKIVEHNGITVIEDCYNASPESMKASLGILAQMPCSGRHIAVVGNMNELGTETEVQHKIVGVEAARNGIDMLLCCGDKTVVTAEAAAASGVACVKHFDTSSELSEYLNSSVHKGDCVMFKASRTMKFEEIISELYKKQVD